MKKLFTIFLILAWLPLAHADDVELRKADEAYAARDYKTAFSIVKPLAEQGNAEAQFELGFQYSNGEGIPQNYKEALKWYRKSAKQGHAKAQTFLGGMYATSRGVPLDFDKAYVWLSLGQANGNEKGAKLLEVVSKGIKDLEKVQELATQCWESNYQNCGE